MRTTLHWVVVTTTFNSVLDSVCVTSLYLPRLAALI